jgi:hypothetical protein
LQTALPINSISDDFSGGMLTRQPRSPHSSNKGADVSKVGKPPLLDVMTNQPRKEIMAPDLKKEQKALNR